MDFHQASLYLLAVKISTHTTTDQRLLTAHANLTERVTPIYEDARSYFTARLFISHISAFKIFLQKIVALVIQKHPKKVGSIEFRLSDTLDASSNAELVQRATDEFLNRIMYKKPHEYLSDLCGLLSINKAFFESGWKIFSEAKARRDLGVHNAWICNATYHRKVAEAGSRTALKIGESAVPNDALYVQPLLDALLALSETISEAVVSKHWPEMLQTIFPVDQPS